MPDYTDVFTWERSTAGHTVWEQRISERPKKAVRAYDHDGKMTVGYAKTWTRDGNEWCVLPCDRAAEVKTYQPLTSPYLQLFREFAQTKTTPTGVVEFANRYGLLGSFRTAVIDEPGVVRGVAEPLKWWYREIAAMRDAVALWERARDAEDWRADVVSLLNTVNVELQDRVVQRVVWNELRGEFDSLPLPVSLIGALWLQVSWAMGRRANFAKCPNCGKTIEKASGRLTGKRADAVYCGEECKTAMNNSLRSAAVKLLRQGRPLREIARVVGVAPKRVQTWKKQIQSRQTKGR